MLSLKQLDNKLILFWMLSEYWSLEKLDNIYIFLTFFVPCDFLITHLTVVGPLTLKTEKSLILYDKTKEIV